MKLFIQNATSFDFAFLAHNFYPIGQSFYLDINLEGETNKNGMLIDFSDLKDKIKSVVQDFDHKLLTNKANIKYQTKSQIIASVCSNNFDFFALCTKRSWVQIVPDNILTSLIEKKIAAFEIFLSKKILRLLPKNIKKISVILKEKINNFLSDEQCCYFNYTHSLCKHKGHCHRFHGHSSRVQVLKNGQLNHNLTSAVAHKLNGYYIVSKDYLCESICSLNLNKIKKYCFKKNQFETLKNSLNIVEYKTPFGKVSILISKHLSLILNQESTIESITQYIHKYIQQDYLKKTNHQSKVHNQDIIEVCIYEGLSKGAIAL